MTEDTTPARGGHTAVGADADAPGTAAPPPSAGRRLHRRCEGRLFAGVCAGIGQYTGVDPVVIRVGFAVVTIATFGGGLLLYVAAFLLMSDENCDRSIAENLLKRPLDGDAVLALLALVLGAVVLINVTGQGFSDTTVVVITVLALVALVAHSRGVDPRTVLRSLPDRLMGNPPPSASAAPEGAASRPGTPHSSEAVGGPEPAPAGTAPSWRRPEMIDLAQLAERHRRRGADPAGVEGRPARSGRSLVTPVTIGLALAAVGVSVPVATSYPPAAAVQIMLAVGLAVVALGLAVAGVREGGHALIAVGTVLTLGLAATSAATEIPLRGRIGDPAWWPTDVGQISREYRILAGHGTLDLTGLPLRPGQRVRVRAEVSLGELVVVVPTTARVKVAARSGIGDIAVDNQIVGGVHHRVDRVLEPEEKRPGEMPVIELDLRARVGDLVVERA